LRVVGSSLSPLLYSRVVNKIALSPNSLVGLPALEYMWGRPRDASYTAAEWAKIALDATRRFVEKYEAALVR
jgi:hypothetical protein